MTVKKGDTVTVEYEGKLEDGTVFDTSNRDGTQQPLTFQAGVGQVVPGFDNAILGMKENEEKEFTLKPEEAYGERRDELEQKIPRNALPQDQEPKPGMMLMVSSPDGRQMPVKITAVDGDTVTLDLNHPLAGKTLIFKIKVTKIEEGNPEPKDSPDSNKPSSIEDKL